MGGIQEETVAVAMGKEEEAEETTVPLWVFFLRHRRTETKEGHSTREQSQS